jgi:Ca-activated chloride channel family protein
MISKSLAVVLTFLVATAVAAQAPTALSDRDEVVRKLSRRERKERISKLDVKHQEFVEYVEPIMLPVELDMFLSLEDPTQRDAFVDEFWRRRDHMNRTSGVFRDVYYRRLDIAKEQFKKISTDRARMFLLHGPPTSVVRSNCQRLLQPTEIWKYDEIPGIGRDLSILFYKPRHQGDYRVWNPVGGSIALAELLVAPDAVSAQSSAADASAARNRLTTSDSPYAYINKIQFECTDGNEIMLAITQMVQSRIDLLRLFAPPELDNEDVQRMMRSVVVANPNAPKLTTRFLASFPAKSGSRTDVQMTLFVPRNQLSPAEAGGSEAYTIDVAGEVLKDGELWEKYRYRFDFPGDVGVAELPIVIDRLLRPARYVSRIKITDANTGAEAVVEKEIEVPEIFETEEPVVEANDAAPAPVVGSAAIDAPAVEAVSAEPRIRIIPPPDAIVKGLQTVETLVSGKEIKAVEFWLDGRKIATRRADPFALDLDFGEVPQMRRIRAVALDAHNAPLTGDELTVNAGTDPFRVRITSPRVAPRLSGPSRVEIDVSVPEEEKLASLELFWNETRMATMYDPPFVQTIDIPRTEGVGYIRAVATLENAAVAPIEDVVMINTPAYMEELNVHLVELPTTVVVDGRPVHDLSQKSFKLLDEGKAVSIAKFDRVTNLPLSIGMAIDASGSMMNRMEEAQKAGAQFFENVMKRGDKAFVVAFATQPQLVQKWSPKVADAHAALAKLRAEDKTALYDAIVYSLYNFHGIRGQKALVVISDGKDTASSFTYDQTLEYARRTGVPIYGVGIGIRSNEADVRFKLDRICRETGGATFYIEQARDLQRVYDDIQAELRSQYILGFYPSPDVKQGKWREVTVQVDRGKAKTIRGYFP